MTAARPLSAWLDQVPPERVRAVPIGSLPRNHVGFFRTLDGVALVVNSQSPCEREGITEPRHFIDYESEAATTSGLACEAPLRRAMAACRDAERAFGGSPRGSADCRAAEEMNSAAREVGEAMLSLRRAAHRYGINLEGEM